MGRETTARKEKAVRWFYLLQYSSLENNLSLHLLIIQLFTNRNLLVKICSGLPYAVMHDVFFYKIYN